MSAAEASPLWYRIAGVKPRLRDHVVIHRHHYRGRLWYVVEDAAAHRYYRFGPGAYELIRELDGKRSIDQIMTDLVDESREDPPGQDEIIRLLAELHANDLIQCDVSPDTRELFARLQKGQRQKWKRYIKGPLLIRIPLSDPDALLTRLDALAAPLFRRPGLVLWLTTVALAGVLALTHWGEIGHYWNSRALAPYNLLLLVLTYPAVKGLHELAHGLAVKRWGGEVHEMGIMLLVFMPLPYVDASTSSAFRDKHRRMLVGAAGILMELFLAALATFVWLSVETGLVRDFAFDVMLIGGISTVLFNGNPLLRFDGYYVLADALEIPNLAQRANGYYGYLAQRYLLGVGDARSPAAAPGERAWFIFFGLASTLYRLFILAAIVLFLAEEFLAAGVLLGAVAIVLQVVNPLLRQFRFLAGSPKLNNRRLRSAGAVAAVLASTGILIFYVPLPAATYAQGVIWLPERAHVRAGVDGFIDRVVAAHESGVTAGDTLFEALDPLLTTEVESLEWELRALEARFDQKLTDDQVEAAIIQGRIAQVNEDLRQARQKAAELTIASPTNGTFLVAGAHHLVGRYARQGEVLGYVSDLASPIVRAVIRQADIGLVRENTRAVRVRLADQPGRTLPATVQRLVPSSTGELPSPALGSTGGGPIAVEPGDPEGRTATEEVFLVDVALPANVDLERIGTRVHLRFEHDRMPLAPRLYRALRQLLLSRLAV